MVLIVCVMAQLLPAASVSAKVPVEPLARWDLVIGEAGQAWYPPYSSALPDGWQRSDAPPGSPGAPADGTWTVGDIRFVDGRYLDLHVTVTPPTPAMALEAGPATLFTSIGIWGGFGGDVGYQRLVSVGHTALPTCGDPCRFQADVRLDLHRLPNVIRRDGANGGKVGVGLTLVRTFAGGTWLQTIDGYDRSEDAISTGTVGHPEPWAGRALPVGLYAAATAAPVADGPFDEPLDYLAIVEADRTSTGDASVPVASTPVRVIATFTGCKEPVTASLDTAEGDIVSLAPERSRDYLDSTVELPVGTSWRASWAREPSTPIPVGDSPLLVAASLRCSDRDGRTVDGLTVAEVQPR